MASSNNARSRFSSSASSSNRTMESNRSVEQRSIMLNFLDSLDSVLHCNSALKCAVISAVVLLFSAIDFSLSGKLDVLGFKMIDFGERNNALNMYFVKVSWFWTLVCVVPLSTSTGYLLRGLDFRAVIPSLGRMVLATAFWWTFTTLFIRVDGFVGSCSGGDNLFDRVACYRQGHSWSGFDISGHIFILTYSILLITEELAALQAVHSLHSIESDPSAITSDRHKHLHARETVKRVKSWSFYFKCVCLIFMVAAFTMLVATSLFFHTFTEKILGLMLAVLSWWSSYRFLYSPDILNWMPARQMLV